MQLESELGGFGKLTIYFLMFALMIIAGGLFYSSIISENTTVSANNLNSTLGIYDALYYDSEGLEMTSQNLNEKIQTGGAAESGNAEIIINNAYDALKLFGRIPTILGSTITNSGKLITDTFGANVLWLTSLTTLTIMILTSLFLWNAATGRQP